MKRLTRIGLSILLAVPLLTDSSPVSAAANDVIPHRTSWLGETLPADEAAHVDLVPPGVAGFGRRWVQDRVSAMYVDSRVSDGKVYTNSVFDEAAREKGIYQFANGVARPAGQLYPQGSGGRVVAADEKYVYADHTKWGETRPDGTAPDLGQVLVRFQRGAGPYPNPYYADVLPMSTFSTGEPVASLWKAGRMLSGKPGGIATGRGLVFMSRPEENLIYVYEREEMTLLAKIPARNPAALAYRHTNNTLFALAEDNAGRRTVRTWSVTSDKGATTPGPTITDVGTSPVALAVNPNRLVIADNALTVQQVRIYGDCALCPQGYLMLDRIGAVGGAVAHHGAYADANFDNLTGVGIDAPGNIYVAANGRGTYGWTDIRRFTRGQALDGKLINYVFQDTVVPDPRDPTEVYSAFHKYKLDYSAPTPGTEWSPDRTTLTVNRAACPQDGRNPAPVPGDTDQTQAVAVRYLVGSDGKERKYLFVRPTGNAYTSLGIYRDDGDDLHPSVLFSAGVKPWPDGTPPATGHRQAWTDTIPNCRIDPNEIDDTAGPVPYATFAQTIDQRGGIWGTGVNDTMVHHLPLNKFDGANNPMYGADEENISLAGGPMDRVLQLYYVDATDTMYMYGWRGSAPDATQSPRWILARYEKFSTAQRQLAWSIDMAYQNRCWDGHEDYCSPNGLAVAGNRIYVADIGAGPGDPPGRVRVFTTDRGVYQGSLDAGPEVSRFAGWVDTPVTGITATVLPSGEHVIFREEQYLGRVLMYRYTPS